MTQPLTLTPNNASVGQQIEATFELTNTGDASLTVIAVVGFRDPHGANADFRVVSGITLAPGQRYTYRDTKTLSIAGGYTAWPAIFTCGMWIELAARMTLSVTPAQASCPPWGAFSSVAGAWPPACFTFFQGGPVNLPVPANPRIDPDSDRMIATLMSAGAKPANLLACQSGNCGWPTVYGTANDPVYTIQCTDFGGACSVSGMRLHAPAGSIHQGGCSANPYDDNHITIVDTTSGLVFDLWRVQTCPLPATSSANPLPVIQIGWGGYSLVDGNGISEGSNGNGTASHFSNLEGRIREEELEAGEIRHPLAWAIPCDSGNAVYPAKASDKQCAPAIAANAPPMGARFWLDMSSSAIDSLPIPKWKQILLKALSSYGAYAMDTGSSFWWSWQTESGSQYTAFGYPDRWLAYAKNNGWTWYNPDQDYVASWGGTDNGIDWNTAVWSHLKVLAPCVSDGSCR